MQNAYIHIPLGHPVQSSTLFNLYYNARIHIKQKDFCINIKMQYNNLKILKERSENVSFMQNCVVPQMSTYRNLTKNLHQSMSTFALI